MRMPSLAQMQHQTLCTLSDRVWMPRSAVVTALWWCPKRINSSIWEETIARCEWKQWVWRTRLASQMTAQSVCNRCEMIRSRRIVRWWWVRHLRYAYLCSWRIIRKRRQVSLGIMMVSRWWKTVTSSCNINIITCKWSQLAFLSHLIASLTKRKRISQLG